MMGWNDGSVVKSTLQLARVGLAEEFHLIPASTWWLTQSFVTRVPGDPLPSSDL